jgi:hypothetical protein
VADQEYAQEELNTLMKKYKENEDNKATFFNEQKKSGVKPAEKKLFGPSETPVATMTKVEETVNEVIEETTNTLFSGPPDLVLERKMKAAEEASNIPPSTD